MDKPQLGEAVNKLPEDIKAVVVSSDAEGNEFNFIDEFSVGYVYRDELNSGYVGTIMSEEDILEDSEDGKIPDIFTKVAIIWPY